MADLDQRIAALDAAARDPDLGPYLINAWRTWLRDAAVRGTTALSEEQIEDIAIWATGASKPKEIALHAIREALRRANDPKAGQLQDDGKGAPGAPALPAAGLSPEEVREAAAKLCENVDEITLFIGRPISTEAEFHSIVRDLFFLKAAAIRAMKVRP